MWTAAKRSGRFLHAVLAGGGNEVHYGKPSGHACTHRHSSGASPSSIRHGIEPSNSELETIIDAAAVARDPQAAQAALRTSHPSRGDLAIMEYAKLNKDAAAGV